MKLKHTAAAALCVMAMNAFAQESTVNADELVGTYQMRTYFFYDNSNRQYHSVMAKIDVGDQPNELVLTTYLIDTECGDLPLSATFDAENLTLAFENNQPYTRHPQTGQTLYWKHAILNDEKQREWCDEPIVMHIDPLTNQIIMDYEKDIIDGTYYNDFIVIGDDEGRAGDLMEITLSHVNSTMKYLASNNGKAEERTCNIDASIRDNALLIRNLFNHSFRAVQFSVDTEAKQIKAKDQIVFDIADDDYCFFLCAIDIDRNMIINEDNAPVVYADYEIDSATGHTFVTMPQYMGVLDPTTFEGPYYMDPVLDLSINIDDLIKANVKSIETAGYDTEQPVTYFNLQGQPVSQPLPGNLVIRRQGQKSEKVIF